MVEGLGFRASGRELCEFVLVEVFEFRSHGFEGFGRRV